MVFLSYLLFSQVHRDNFISKKIQKIKNRTSKRDLFHKWLFGGQIEKNSSNNCLLLSMIFQKDWLLITQLCDSLLELEILLESWNGFLFVLYLTFIWRVEYIAFSYQLN